jgi:multidrug resistance efflux pump
MTENVLRKASRVLAVGLVALLVACNRGPHASGNATPAPIAPSPDATASASSGGDEKGATSAVPVETATVRRGTIPEIVTAYGTVSGGANSQASLAFPESGRIVSVDVTVGERVRTGQVLAELDARPFEADVAQAAAALRAAQANVERTKLGVRPQQVAQTNAQLDQARTQLALAQAQLQREQKLLALGIASQADVDAATAALATAQSQMKVLQEQRISQLHPWQPDVDAANAGAAQAQAALAGAQQKLALARIVAPFSGVVIARLHNDGESVDASTPVLQIASDGPPIFTAQFAPNDAARLHLADVASVQPQGVSGEVAAGRVIAINSAQGDARTVGVLIRLATRVPAFGPGAYGQASVRVGSKHGLIVPTASIVADAATGAVQVFRRDGDRYTPVPVTVIATEGQRAIVTGPGLRSGSVVAGRGAAELLTPQQPAQADKD